MKYLKLYQNYNQDDGIEAQNESSLTEQFLFKAALILGAIAPIIGYYREYLRKKKKYVFDADMTQKLYDVTGEKVNVYSYEDLGITAAASDNYIVYNPSFLNLFTEREMMAVLLHEFCHVKNKDLIKRQLMSILGHIPFIFWTNTGIYFLYFLLSRIFYFGGYFSHRREFAADSYTKKYGYEADLASAFLKLEEIRNQQGKENLFKDLYDSKDADSKDPALLRLDQIINVFIKFEEMIKTHPKIYKRIKNLYFLADNKEKFFEDIIDSTSKGTKVSPWKVTMVLDEIDKEQKK